MPKFSTDWFRHHEPQWRELMAAMAWPGGGPLTAIEIGSFEGRSAMWLLENLLTHPESKLFCIDTFAGGIEHTKTQVDGLFQRFRENIDETGRGSKVEVRRGYSGAELVRLIGEDIRADFAYVDGSHQAADVLEDLVLTFRTIKPGGLMIFDDYIWTMEEAGKEDILNSPKISIDAFTNIYRRKLRILPFQRLCQLAVVKTRD